MTKTDLTRFSIFLDLEDMDGIIDIAKFGIVSLIDHKPICILINKLAYTIARAVSEKESQLNQPEQSDVDDDFENDLEEDRTDSFEGRALLKIVRIPATTVTELDFPDDERFH